MVLILSSFQSATAEDIALTRYGDHGSSIFATTVGAKADLTQILAAPEGTREFEVGINRYTDFVIGGVAGSPDGKLYCTLLERIDTILVDETLEEMSRSTERTAFIQRFLPSFDDPNPEIETIYTFPGYLSMYSKQIRDAGESGMRIYYSSGTTSGGRLGEIYYIGEDGNPVLYYTVHPDDVYLFTSCGSNGSWAGDFAFDDRNDRLYLSSGNHVPSGIFMVSEAGLDAVSDTSTVTLIHESSNESISNLDFPPGHFLYFLSDHWTRIHKLDLNEDPSSEERDTIIFEDPSGDRITSFAIIRRHGGIPSPYPMMRFPGLPSRTLDQLESGARDISVYEPIPDLQGMRAGPNLPLPWGG